MIIVHHLGISQSERVVWACEELGLPYEMKRYDRVAGKGMAPPEYKALWPFGTAPVIQDGDITMGESGAIVEYLCMKYGNGRLTVEPKSPNFAPYLFWFHFANGSLMPSAMISMPYPGVQVTQREQVHQDRVDRAYGMIEQRLGEAPYFAGPDFTAADIMMLFPMTTLRSFAHRDLSGSLHLLTYLARIGARPGYQRAMKKGDPAMTPKLT